MKLLLASEFDGFFPKIKNGALLKPYKKLAYIPTAATHDSEQQPYFRDVVKKQFAAHGIQCEYLDIAAASAQQIKTIIDKSDIVYVGGGNTFYLLEKMKAVNFKHLLQGFFQKGGLYIGSSAGSIVTCPEIKYAAEVDDPKIARLSNTAGLNLINLLLVPHIDHKEYGAACRKICADLKNQNSLVVGLKDNQALYVQDNYIEIV